MYQRRTLTAPSPSPLSLAPVTAAPTSKDVSAPIIVSTAPPAIQVVPSTNPVAGPTRVEIHGSTQGRDGFGGRAGGPEGGVALPNASSRSAAVTATASASPSQVAPPSGRILSP